MDENDHGAWMDEQVGLAEQARPHAASPPATTTADDDAPTPGREDSPIGIPREAIGEWIAYGHLMHTTLIAGEHKGKALWWDCEEMYKLDDGCFARIVGS